MSTRAIAGGSSHHAKQKVVTLLFGAKYAGKGPAAHQQLDHSIYSYKQLKTAYLQEIHRLHPDKHEKESAKTSQFVTLKDAWIRYNELAKMMKKVKGDAVTDASFTMFGVGCSFADTEDEKALRDKITDQACRGWFSAGALGNGEKCQHDDRADDDDDHDFVKKVSLTDDDYFVPYDDHIIRESKAEQEPKRPCKPRNFLVGHLVRPSRDD